MTTPLRLNWFAVLGAALVHYLLAVPWFALLGAAWREAVGLSAVPETNSVAAYVVPLVGSFTATLAMGLLLSALRIERVRTGALLGAGLAASFVLTAVATDAVAPHQPHPLAFFLIVGGYHLLGLTLSAGILARFCRPR